ncbi:MAG: diacylglycerol kinase [Burkholderiales bacterium]
MRDPQINDSSTEESPFKGKTGLTRMLNACRYTAQGLTATYRNEEAFRQEVWAAVVLIPLALLLPLAGAAKAVMIAAVVLVLIVELINSALEAVVDRVSLERHPLAGRAKDIGSAAVAVSIVNCVTVWLLCWFA